ncbi:hypothetical protein JCM24511_03003 [Saitozyma sp. JCM 24511]|nr:hypothetical protein JCM24511_03003 [Saitozyma sp. JCM 24511]
MQPANQNQNQAQDAVVAQPTAKKTMTPLAVEEPTPDNASTASKSSWFPLRLRGGIGPCCAMIDACLCCCALEDICCCGLAELC